MSGAVQVGALVINMAADIASLKTNLNDATRAAQTASQKMAADLTGGLKSIEAALGPLQSLTVKFGTLEKQMSSAKDSAVSLAKGLILGAAAGMSIDAIKEKIGGVIEGMAHLKELSEKTGTSVENLSKLGFFAKQSGTDIDIVSDAMVKLAKGMAGADNTAKGAGLALHTLGLSARDASGNLKDPSAMFTEIANKMDHYRDSAGKSALANALIKGSGADLLPMMKLMAEQGDIQAKVTDAQASAALQYERDLGKLNAQKGMLFKTIALALLPTMTDFSNAMLDASKNTNIVNKAAKDLQTDGSITDWADTAAMGVARLMDVIMMIPRALKAVSSSFKVVGNDIGLLATIAVKRNDPVAIALALGARNEALKEANDNYSDLWNYDGAKMEKAMAARIEARAKVAAKAKGTETDKPILDFNTTADEDAKAAQAAADKEAAAYATVITAIRAKTSENNLQLASNETLSESQKLQIKLDEELASGKIILSAKHREAANAALVEMAASEQLIKAQAAQKEVTKFIAASTAARDEASAALNVEYQMYGKSADARDIEMVAVKAEADMQKQLAALREKNLPISDQIITQLNAERDARVLVEQATMGQGKALQYAAQLAAENKKFGIDYIADDRQRAAAQLSLDSQVWQERIRLAGEGTDAQKALQEQFDVWYANQSIKPALDEQKKMWGSIEQTAHDTFISIFDSGKSAFDRLRDALKNGLLDLLYQMTLKKWIVNIGATVGMGTAGVAQAGNGGTGDMFATAAAGSSNPLIQAVGAASNMYKSITGGLSGIGNTIASGMGQGIEYLGSQFGSSAATSFGQGMQGFGADGSLGGLSGAGATTGSIVGQIGGTVGGYMVGSTLNSAISGKYETGSGIMTTEKIATAVASYFSPVAGAVVGAISGLINRAFGMGPTELQGSGLRGSLGASGITGETYQNLHQDGGWFRSDKNWTDAKALTTEMSSQLTQAFSSLKQVSGEFAQSLGVGTDSLAGYTKAFDIAFTNDAAQNQQAIASFFTGVGDELAKMLVPSLDQFSRSGETASATLQRLAGDFTATNQIAQLLGKSAMQMFGSAGMDSATARENLISAAGGLSALSQEAQSFNQNFLTDAERLAPVQKALSEALESLGYACLQTRDDFKDAVNGLIESGAAATEEGAKELSELLALTDAYAQVHPDTSAADAQKAADVLKQRQDLQGQLDGLMLTSTELLARQRDALDASNRGLFDQVQAATAAKAAIEQAQASAAAAQADSLKAQAEFNSGLSDFFNKMADVSRTLRSFSDSLNFGALSPLSKSGQYDMLKGELSKAAPQDVQAIANAFLQASKDRNGSNLAYAHDFAMTQQLIGKAAATQDQRALDMASFFRSSIPFMADGSHAAGLSNVPFDGYRAILHKDEAVLTATENRQYRAPRSTPQASSGMSEATAQRLIAAIEKMQGSSEDAARHARTTANILTRVTKDGKSLITTAN